MILTWPTTPLPLLLRAALNNELVGQFVAARFLSTRRLAPRRLGAGHTSRLTAFAAAVRMVTRGHRRASHRRPDSEVALSTRLAQFDVRVIQISHLADSRQAFLWHEPHLTRWQAHLRILAFFRQ